MKTELEVVSTGNVLGRKFTIYGTIEDPLFLAKDVAEWIEYSKTSGGSYDVWKMIQTVDDDEKVKKICDIKDTYTTSDESSRARNTQEMWFLTEKGLISVLSKTRKISNDKRKILIKSLQNLGFLKDFYFSSPKETEFIDLLEQTLEPLDIKGIKQYFHKNKRIDYYIPSLKLAVEYDENDHKGYTFENQDERQKILEEELNCKFIRLSDKNSNGYNVGLVIKEIFKN